MGSKRIGLGRTQTLIENLARSIDWNSASFADVKSITCSGAITASGGVQAQAQCAATVMASTAGDDIADNASALQLTTASHGKVHNCLLDGASKTVTLPANVTAADIGTTITIVQGASLVGSGVLTIAAGAGNTFSANSYIIGRNSSAGTVTRPAESDTSLVITGAATNSAWGLGSRLTAICVAAGEWFLEGECQPIGTGNNAIAFS